MCYRTRDPRAAEFKVIRERNFHQHYDEGKLNEFRPKVVKNGFAHDPMLVTYLSNETGTTLSTMRWGLVPFWVKDDATSSTLMKKTLNCISEEATTKPSFRASIFKKNCLIWVAGFYETRHEADGTKIPYFIHAKHGEPFAFAGIYDVYTSPSGIVTAGCSILTCNPGIDSKMGYIHNSKVRSPAILMPDKEELWLHAKNDSEMRDIITPNDFDSFIVAHTVSSMVNSPKSNPSDETLTDFVPVGERPSL